MGRRSRQRAREAGPQAGLTSDPVPSTRYRDPDGNELELRWSLTARARTEYRAVLTGGLNREDAWQRGVELLFERLAVSWTISGARIERQRELVGRYRMASQSERRFVRESLRAHLVEHFPELEAP